MKDRLLAANHYAFALRPHTPHNKRTVTPKGNKTPEQVEKPSATPVYHLQPGVCAKHQECVNADPYYPIVDNKKSGSRSGFAAHTAGMK